MTNEYEPRQVLKLFVNKRIVFQILNLYLRSESIFCIFNKKKLDKNRFSKLDGTNF